MTEQTTPPQPARAMSHWQLVSLLAALAWIGPFAVDTYMPSFPAIAASLGASQVEVQQTLSIYLFAFAFMLLFLGALSDAFGRRRVILCGVFAFVIGSIGCAMSQHIYALWFFRGVQGAAAGAGMIVGRAVIRDLFAGAEAQRAMSRLTLIFGLAPAVAPIIGGWLEVAFGWHSIFVFLALIGAALFWVSYAYLPESLPPPQRLAFHPVLLLRGFRSVLSHRGFLLLAFAVALNFSAFFLYIAAAPVFLMQLLGLRADQFAWLFLPSIIGIMTGAAISGRLAGRIGPPQTVRLAYAILWAAALLNLLYNLYAQLSLPWAVLFIALYTVGMQLAMQSITLLILDLFPRTRGLVASLQGFIASTLNAVVAGLLAPLLAHSKISLALGMVLLLSAGFLCWWLYSTLTPTRTHAQELA